MEDDYAHCNACDGVINLDQETNWKVIDDNTYHIACIKE